MAVHLPTTRLSNFAIADAATIWGAPTAPLPRRSGGVSKVPRGALATNLQASDGGLERYCPRNTPRARSGRERSIGGAAALLPGLEGAPGEVDSHAAGENYCTLAPDWMKGP